MDLNSEQNTINWISGDKNIFLLIFKNFYSNDTIINDTINLMIKNNWIHLFNNSTNKSILFYLVSKCSETICLKMLEHKLIDIDWKDNYSNNLIHWACKRNYIKLFDMINTTHPDNQLFNAKNKGGRTPVHIACIKNNLILTKLLDEKNIKLTVDYDSNYKTHIHYGIKYGSKDLVLYLLKKYVESDFNYGSELFYDIITYQDEEVVDYFISNTNLNINETNLFWTLALCVSKKYYSTMYSYGKKKTSNIIYKFIHELSYSYDGHIVDDLYDDNYNTHKM